jgi:hypothetical protein
LTVVRELVRRHPKDERWEPEAVGVLPGEWEPSLHHEIAAALGISTVAAGKLTRLAWTLDTRLRRIGQALEDNELDPARVKLIADETSVLEDEALYPKAEQIILDGLPHCKTWGALQRLVQRAVITVDPEGARRRREQAERERARVRFWREACGTCAMQATGLPTDQALAANANIEARARACKAAGVDRPMDILRVMAYLDLLNGVTVAQRAAWARAEDEDRLAEEAERRRAQSSTRPDSAPGRAGRDPEAAGHLDACGPESSPGDDGPGLDSDGPGTYGPEGGSGRGTPDDGSPGDNGPGLDSDGPDGGGPGMGPDDDGPGPDGSAPGGGGPGDGGARPDGGAPDGGYPRDWPTDDSGLGDDESPPEDPGDGHGNEDPARPHCQQCSGVGGGTGLPVRATLTIPAGALEWLAEWSASNVESTARGPTGTGGGGPGSCSACGSWGSASLPARQYLVFPLLTLAGLAGRSGEAHGLGALDPALVRDLAAAGARHPGSQFCLTVTDEHGHAVGHGCLRSMRGKKGRAIPVDPGSPTITPSGRAGPGGGHGSWILTLPGAPLPLITDIYPVPTYGCDHRFQSAGYQPSERLRHLIQVRDGECSFPACSRHARESDFEHGAP